MSDMARGQALGRGTAGQVRGAHGVTPFCLQAGHLPVLDTSRGLALGDGLRSR
jgi:hypothetical protein